MAAGVISVRIKGNAVVRGVSYKAGDTPTIPINSAAYLVAQGVAEYARKSEIVEVRGVDAEEEDTEEATPVKPRFGRSKRDR